MRKLLLSISLAAFAASATAQCFDPAYGTSLGSGGDVLFPIQPIGFAFPFCGTTYTHIEVATKGFVYLSNAGVPANPGYPDFTADPNDLLQGAPMITALWSDIQLNAPGELFTKSTPTTFTITWKDAQCYSASSGIFSMQMELSISGTIKLLFGPGTTNASLASQPTWFAGLVGVSPGTGTLPAGVDVSVGGATPNNIMFEAFPAINSFDMPNNGLLLIPTNPGWTYVPLGAPVNCASVTSYGDGCVAKIDSVYEAFTSGFDLNNTTITWLRVPGGYTMLTGIPSAFVPPSGSALNIASGFLDGEQTVALSVPMPVAGGTTNSLNVTTKGQVEFASSPSGFIDFTPSGQELLDWSRTAFHCWHDYNQTSPGSGLILFEEVAGIAYVTWNGVYSYSAAVPNTFQFQFDLTSGNVVLVIQTLNGATSPDAICVGYSVGGVSVDPGATDISALAGVVNVFDSPNGVGLEPMNGPSLGNPAFTLRTKDVPPLIPLAFLAFGDTVINPGIDLTFLGMPGCRAYTNANLVTISFGVVGTSGSVSFPIPSNPTLIGATLSSQSLAFSLDTPFGLVSSNGVAFTVGN